jgi:hypothetical protein
LTLVDGVGETNARKDRTDEESTVTGKQEFRMAWREERNVLPACLRSVLRYADIHQLAGSLSPAYGGPPD